MLEPPKSILGIVIRWLARALSVLIILVFVMFAIRGFGSSQISTNDILSFVILLLSIAGLVYSFFNEKFGGIGALVTGILYIIIQGKFNFYFVFIPLSGALFLLSWMLSKDKKN